MVDINLQPLTLGEEKTKKKEERNHRVKNIMSASATQGDHKKLWNFLAAKC